MSSLRRAAREALAAAVERHGLDAMQLYPVPDEGPEPPQVGFANYLGVTVKTSPPWRIAGAPSLAAIDASPEADHCRAAFERWMETMLEAGVLSGNLERLGREYRRVERRAKALENVLLPEVETSLKRVVEQLDVMDQEEAVRVRTAVLQRRTEAA